MRLTLKIHNVWIVVYSTSRPENCEALCSKFCKLSDLKQNLEFHNTSWTYPHSRIIFTGQKNAPNFGKLHFWQKIQFSFPSHNSKRVWDLFLIDDDRSIAHSRSLSVSESLLDGTTSQKVFLIKALRAFKIIKGNGSSSLVSEGTQVILTATIQENCSRRSEVAAKFPEMVR